MGFAAGDTNLFRFVGNNPTNATDPSGLVGPADPPLGWFPGERGLKNNLELSAWIAKGAQLALASFDGESIPAVLDAMMSFRREAEAFAKEVRDSYSNALGYSPQLREWIFNAAQHYYWQAMLTIRYGPKLAELIGDLHENNIVGEVDEDRAVDTYHNEMARAFAMPYRRRFLDSAAQGVPKPNTAARFDREVGINAAVQTLVWARDREKIADQVKKDIRAMVAEIVRQKAENKPLSPAMILFRDDPRLKTLPMNSNRKR